jgi:hypothetical protein
MPDEMNLMNVTPTNIHEALILCRQACPYIQKKKVQGLGYEIVGIEDVIKHLRPAMDLYQVSVTPEVIRPIKLITLAGGVKADGSPKSAQQRSVVLIQYRLTHGPSDTSVIASGIGEAMDVGDKSAIKAATAAYKMMIRQVFVLETGLTDPDTRASEQAGASEKRYGRWRKAMLAAKTQSEFVAAWRGLLPFPWSDAQMKGLRATADPLARQFAVILEEIQPDEPSGAAEDDGL